MKGRRPVRTAAASALALSLLGAVAARAAFAEPATPTAYPAGTTGTRFSGLAFDACDAPSRATLQAWRSSPFGAVGIYISGGHRACRQNQLTAEWVRDVTLMGWKLLPLDVGLQAPCVSNTRLRTFSSNPATARSQGSTAATGALAAAKNLGLRPGSAIYSDLEHYAANDPGCTNAVRSYVTGWTRTLHQAGYLSGVYGNTNRVVRDLAASYDSTSHARPDAVWGAQWNGTATTSGWPSVPDAQWPNHQRIKQYKGDHRAQYGGVTLTIDANALDAPVATVALPYRITGTAPVVARLRPHTGGPAKATLGAGSTVQVICRLPTALGVWDKLVDGSFVPDAAVAAGAPKPALPACATPYQVAIELLNLRRGPGVAAAVVGTIRGGALAWVICETPGITVGRPGYWQKLDTGQWTSGPLLARAAAHERAPGVPLCNP